MRLGSGIFSLRTPFLHVTYVFILKNLRTNMQETNNIELRIMDCRIFYEESNGCEPVKKTWVGRNRDNIRQAGRRIIWPTDYEMATVICIAQDEWFPMRWDSLFGLLKTREAWARGHWGATRWWRFFLLRDLLLVGHRWLMRSFIGLFLSRRLIVIAWLPRSW